MKPPKRYAKPLRRSVRPLRRRGKQPARSVELLYNGRKAPAQNTRHCKKELLCLVSGTVLPASELILSGSTRLVGVRIV